MIHLVHQRERDSSETQLLMGHNECLCDLFCQFYFKYRDLFLCLGASANLYFRKVLEIHLWDTLIPPPGPPATLWQHVRLADNIREIRHP